RLSVRGSGRRHPGARHPGDQPHAGLPSSQGRPQDGGRAVDAGAVPARKSVVTHVLLALAALVYCAAGMGYLWYLMGSDRTGARFGTAALTAGLVLHGAALAIKTAQYGFSPAMDVEEGLSLV